MTDDKQKKTRPAINGRRKSRFNIGVFFSKITFGFFIEATGKWEWTNLRKVVGSMAMAITAIATTITVIVELVQLFWSE